MTAPIIATLTAINSRRDVYGNCYWAFTYLDHATGKTVRGTISGGESNVRSIMFELNGGKWEGVDIAFQVNELPIREFNRLTKGWAYAGCTPKELAAFIRAELTK